jgi:rubrerythrin
MQPAPAGCLDGRGAPGHLSPNLEEEHVSRIPRFQEYLKTGFTAEAVSAARFRAFADRAERDGKPHLAARWLRLAAAKDRLAVRLLEAAEQVRGGDADLGTAIAEERFENDVLYPKILREIDEPQTAEVFRQLVAAQTEQLPQMEALRRELNAAQGDVQLPPAVDRGAAPPAVPASTAAAAAPASVAAGR